MADFTRSNKIYLQTYRPKERIDIDRENAVPWLSFIGHRLMALGGFISVAVSGIFMSVGGFFSAKKKIREIQSKYEKTIDFTKAGKIKIRSKERPRVKLD